MRDDEAEWIESGAGPANPIRHPDHPHGDDRVHAHRKAHRHNNWYQRHVLLAHTDRIGSDAYGENAVDAVKKIKQLTGLS